MTRTAKCACGRVSAVVSGEPARVLMCHCDYCQKRTGSVLGVTCYFHNDQVLELNGETRLFCDSGSSIGIQYEFCPHCGTTVHWTYGEAMEEAYPGMAKYRGFAVGCFVDSDFPMPQFELQRQFAHHWVPDFQDIETFDSFGDPSKIMAG